METREKKKESLKKSLKECQELRDKYLDGWKRAQAELLNYKKEEKERINGLIDYSREKIILEFLPIMDNLQIAENKISEELKKDQWIKGLLQIKAQLLDFLRSQGVEEIKSKGEKFDPNFHEAVEEVESEEKRGTVIEEIKKGYFFNNKVIRPAKVKIAR